MNVELLTLGHELLDGRRVDTNAAWIGRFLSVLGLQVRFRQTTLDDKQDMIDAFKLAISRSDIVISTGGLGPTQDDLTFEALADSLDRTLEFHPEVEKKILERYAARNIPCPPSNRRQAMLPQGCVVIANPNGTAPGCFIDLQPKMIFAFPGVPLEMEWMFHHFFLETIQVRLKARPLFQHGYSLSGMAESRVEQKIQSHGLDRLDAGDIHLAYTASQSEVEITYSITPYDVSQKDKIISDLDQKFTSAFQDYLIRWNGKRVEEHIVKKFQEKGWKLSIAESMTGGLVTSKIVDVPGCSTMLHEGLVTYSYDAKMALLDVKSETLKNHGAVSVECIREMARGVRTKTRSTFALATSGVAGPGGGSEKKPVGTTYLCWVGPKLEMKNESETEEGIYVKSTVFEKISGLGTLNPDMNKDLNIIEQQTFEFDGCIEKVVGFHFTGDRKRNRMLATNRALMGLYSFIKNY